MVEFKTDYSFLAHNTFSENDIIMVWTWDGNWGMPRWNHLGAALSAVALLGPPSQNAVVGNLPRDNDCFLIN